MSRPSRSPIPLLVDALAHGARSLGDLLAGRPPEALHEPLADTLARCAIALTLATPAPEDPHDLPPLPARRPATR